MNRVDVTWAENGEVAEYELDPLEADLQTGLARQLAEDDQIKRRIRAAGQDPHKFSFEERMRWIAPTNGASANGHSTNGKPTRRVVTTIAAEIERAQVDWLETGRVPVGHVTVVAGFGGVGKSQWTCLLAARNSLGELGLPAATLIATAEDDPATTVVPRLEAVQADVSLVRFVSIATGEGDEDGIAIPDDVPELEQRVWELGANLLVIDPLVAHLPGEIDSHRDQSVRRALAPLYRLAKNCSCAVVVVHLNKSMGANPLLRIGGSVGFGNAARSVLLLDRDPDDPDGDKGQRRVLAHVKSNLSSLAPSLLYRVAPIVLPAEGTAPMVETSRLELLGESEHNGAALLSVGNEEERTAIEEAVGFLRDFLADGTRQRTGDIYKQANSLRISDSTLKRAARRLGVKKTKADFHGGWEWWLAEEAKPNGAEAANPHSSTKSAEPSSLGPLAPSTVTEGTTHLAYLDEEPKSKALDPSGPFADDGIPF